jgi:excisionase family DNA binding protein
MVPSMEQETTALHCGTSERVERLYTPAEAAEYLKVNEQTVRRYLREGKLKGRVLGRVWLITESALAEFFESLPTEMRPRRK